VGVQDLECRDIMPKGLFLKIHLTSATLSSPSVLRVTDKSNKQNFCAYHQSLYQ
jgi:hypothetical protein